MKLDAKTVAYLCDSGYTIKEAAEAMNTHPTQISRIAKRYGIKFDRRKVRDYEADVYELQLSCRAWVRIEAEMRHWHEVTGDNNAAINRTAASWGIPPSAIRAWERGEHHRLD